MPRHFLIGALGGPNFGDEAIFSAWVRAIRKKNPSAELFCDGYNLTNLMRYAKGMAEVVDFKESLWAFSSSLGAGDRGTSIWTYIKNELKKENVINDFINRLNLLNEKKFNNIHIIGGGYFNDIWPANYVILLFAKMLSWKTNAKVVASGLGLTPTNPKDINGLRSLLSTFDYVDVRDRESYDLLFGFDDDNLFYSGDDALIHLMQRNTYFPLKIIGEPILTICIQNDLYPGNTISSEILTDKLLKILAKNKIKKIVYAVALPGDIDGPPTMCIDRLNTSGFTVETKMPFELLEDGFPVSPNGLVITSRYHPHFFSALSGIKGIALTSDPYYTTKHKAVELMGSDWPLIQGREAVHRLPSVVESFLKVNTASFRTGAREDFIKRKRKVVAYILHRSTRKINFPFSVAEALDKLLSSMIYDKDENS